MQARAERDLALSAGGDLTIESAQATFETATRSSSSAASIGLTASVSARGGPSLGVTLSGEMARGRSDSEGIAQVNAQLSAGERLLVSTGGDALVAGAVLRAREIDLLIGGDLVLASRQDTGRIRGSSANIGASLTIGIQGPSSASLNVGGGFERGDRAMVTDQTAIIADERLDAYVEGETRIDGAILASLTGDLTLDTGTLSFTDIKDRARFNAASAQLGISLGAGLPGINLSGELAEAETDAINRATVGEGEIRIRDEAAQTQELAALNRDLDLAQETTRDEAAGVRFYVSDAAVVEIASGFETTRANLRVLTNRLTDMFVAMSDSERAQAQALANAMDPNAELEVNAERIADELVAQGEIDASERDEVAQAMLAASYASLTDPKANAELASCEAPGRQGFNLHDLLFPKAHAAVQVAVAVGAVCARYVMTQGARVLSWYYGRRALENNVEDLIVGGGFTPTAEPHRDIPFPIADDNGPFVEAFPALPEEDRFPAAIGFPIGNFVFGPMITPIPDFQLPNASHMTSQVGINQQNGAEFEQQVINALGPVGGVKNTTLKTVTLSNGTEVTTIPDLWGRNVGGLLEAKNVQNLSLSPQLRAQAQIARETGKPMNLVVSPRTQRISRPLLIDVRSTGGNVFVYDPVTDKLTPW